MKNLLALACACVLACACAAIGPVASTAAAEKPNVILLITDDQGYGDLGCHGNRMIRTPNLDQLYRESVRFTDFHVDPTCSPTRAALMTGRYSTRTGIWHTVMGRSILFRDEVTLADAFAANGYRNAIFGKWHLGDNYPARPQDRGFHHVLIHGGGGIGQTPDYWGNDYFDDHYQVNGQWQPFEGYCTDVFFRQATQFIAQVRNQDQVQPFFVYLTTNVPHGPYLVPDRYQQYYLDRGVPQPMAAFYGMLENFDENVGRLLASLKETGQDQNTIVMFMTDNGTAAGMVRPAGKGKTKPDAADATVPPWPGFNAGMRGAKGSEYDGGHRVPLFIRWPARGIGGGRDVTQLAAHFDVLPTLVELCGLPVTPPNPLDGRSLVPLLEGQDAEWPERTLFVHTQREEIPPKWTRSAAMTQRWRYVNGAELYDMQADPGQATNVADRHPEVVAELRAAYETWWQGLEPSFSRYGYIGIGSEQENPVHFTCMDWHAPTVQQIPWDQSQIKRMPEVNGWWMLDVARAGKYAITLRHKPAEANFPLQADQAQVKLGPCEAKAAVASGATSVTLALDLPAGPARLDTLLTEESTAKSRGAFYVEIKYIQP